MLVKEKKIEVRILKIILKVLVLERKKRKKKEISHLNNYEL